MERVMLKCRKCGRETPEDVLKSNWWICPGCGGYFRMSARERIRLVVDEGSFRELDPAMLGGNPLNFPEYDGKLDKAREQSGERDAVVTGYGKIGKRKCAFFVMDSGFMMGSMGTVVGEKITRPAAGTATRVCSIWRCSPTPPPAASRLPSPWRVT